MLNNLYKSCTLVPMFVFMWSLCGRKLKYREETHLFDLVTT